MRVIASLATLLSAPLTLTGAHFYIQAQLILPESLKLLPVYISSLLKSALLRANDRV